ncbi:MAG: hypothetical protein H6977_09640 [Gammaproteobacteria bacterium]|nr:hypothetical protein [Gammaproteobacteria bacterium]
MPDRNVNRGWRVALLGGLMALVPFSVVGLTELGKREFTCAHGDVYLQASGSKKLYPAAKREEVVLPSDTGILRYTCKYVRSIVTCPLDTEMIRVRRGPVPAKFRVTCMGTIRPHRGGAIGGDSAPGGAE